MTTLATIGYGLISLWILTMIASVYILWDAALNAPTAPTDQE